LRSRSNLSTTSGLYLTSDADCDVIDHRSRIIQIWPGDEVNRIVDHHESMCKRGYGPHISGYMSVPWLAIFWVTSTFKAPDAIRL